MIAASYGTDFLTILLCIDQKGSCCLKKLCVAPLSSSSPYHWDRTTRIRAISTWRHWSIEFERERELHIVFFGLLNFYTYHGKEQL